METPPNSYSKFSYQVNNNPVRLYSRARLLYLLKYRKVRLLDHMQVRDVSGWVEYEEKLEAIYSHASILFRGNDFKEVLELSSEAIKKVLGHDVKSIGKVSDDEILFLDPNAPMLPLNGKGITVRAVNTGTIQIVNDTRLDTDYICREDGLFCLSELAVPIKRDGKVIAVINLEHQEPNAFSETDKRILELLALHISSELTRVEQLNQLEEQNKLKLLEKNDHFISMVTHELRNPIVSIKGYTELIASSLEEKDAQGKKYYEIISRNIDRLFILINDLVDVQRINGDNFEVNLNLVSIDEIIDEAINEILPLIEMKNQNLKVDVATNLQPVMVDEVRINQVIINLLSNAIKFTPNGGNILLSASNRDHDIIVSVRDSGVGLREEDINKLFKQLPKIQHGLNVKSWGLGLNIIKGIINLHGGVVWAKSEGMGKGSTFSFTLPSKREDLVLLKCWSSVMSSTNLDYPY